MQNDAWVFTNFTNRGKVPESVWKVHKHLRISTPLASAGWWPAAPPSPGKYSALQLTNTGWGGGAKRHQMRQWTKLCDFYSLSRMTQAVRNGS